MSLEQLGTIIQDMMLTTLLVSAPALLVSLVVGLVIGLVQSVIQVQEATLTFVPKLAAIALVLVMGGGWMMETMTDHMQELLARAPELIRQ